MELIKPNTKFDFVGHRHLAMALSWILILIGGASLVIKGGPDLGIDFAGGTLVQVKFSNVTTAAQVRTELDKLNLRGLSIQQFGDQPNEFLIKALDSDSKLVESLANRVKATLETTYGVGSVEIRRTEMVGPQVGEDLRNKATWAVVASIIGMLLYITFRFEFRFGMGAVVALAHDVLITLGAFSLMNKEFDLTIVAAFLTIVGYSVNDTVIVCDRIRENMARHSKEKIGWIINHSINETLSRTVMTSGITLLSVIALFFFGGEVLRNFALAMIIGIVVGTHSSIFVASPVILYMEKFTTKSEENP
jgi:preprotein translocase subunit SecF